jgi:hypothetical protein
MRQNEYSKLTDEELIEALKNNKPSPLIDAFFIGFLIGVLIFSIASNTWGVIMLIPIVLIYAFLKKPKKFEALKAELKKRSLHDLDLENEANRKY